MAWYDPRVWIKKFVELARANEVKEGRSDRHEPNLLERTLRTYDGKGKPEVPGIDETPYSRPERGSLDPGRQRGRREQSRRIYHGKR